MFHQLSTADAAAVLAATGRAIATRAQSVRRWSAKRLASISAWLFAMYVHYRVQADPRAKCPACGHREKHQIAWAPEYGHLIHQCTFCKAAWGEPPVVIATRWAVVVTPAAEADPEDGPLKPPFGQPLGQRAPIRVQ